MPTTALIPAGEHRRSARPMDFLGREDHVEARAVELLNAARAIVTEPFTGVFFGHRSNSSRYLLMEPPRQHATAPTPATAPTGQCTDLYRANAPTRRDMSLGLARWRGGAAVSQLVLPAEFAGSVDHY